MAISAAGDAFEIVPSGGVTVTISDLTGATTAADLGIAGSCLHRWLRQADIDEGQRDGLTSDERAELVRLRRANRTLEMENEILKRAAAFFARENVLPK